MSNNNTYWMIVTSIDNFNITKDNKFDIQGIDYPNRKKAQRMIKNDRILYYVKEKKSFLGTATVLSDCFEDDTKIWEHYDSKEKFIYRVKIESNVVLEDGVDARYLAPSMEYIKKWAPEMWEKAFLGMLHIIPQKDFRLIEAELNKL